MNDHVMYFARKPEVTLPVGGVIGAVLGATGALVWAKRKLKREVSDTEAAYLSLKAEMMSQDYDRAEKDRVFNMAIAEAIQVTTELREEGEQILSRMRTVNEMGEKSMADTDELVEDTETSAEHIVEPYAEWTEEPIATVSEIRYTDRGLEVHGERTRPMPEVAHNIFDENNDEWDYDLERQLRDPRKPYIIHIDEFMADEKSFDQSTLTWYAGDDILTDDKDVPIYRPEDVVGDLRFGHGSGSEDLLYVRNEKLEAEYEIVRNEGSYEVEVLGHDVEQAYAKNDLKHSKRPQRFRAE